MNKTKKIYLTPAAETLSFKPRRVIALSLNGETESNDGMDYTETYDEEYGAW